MTLTARAISTQTTLPRECAEEVAAVLADAPQLEQFFWALISAGFEPREIPPRLRALKAMLK